MSIGLQINIKGLLKIISLSLFLLFISCAAKITYEGGRNQEGEYHGKGVITYPNGEKYVGEFYDNSYDGKGVLFNYYQFE